MPYDNIIIINATYFLHILRVCKENGRMILTIQKLHCLRSILLLKFYAGYLNVRFHVNFEQNMMMAIGTYDEP